MCAYSSTRGAWQQSLSQTARALSTFRYFFRKNSSCPNVKESVCACPHCSLCVSMDMPVCVCVHIGIFFPLDFGANRAGLFVVIHEIALGLYAIDSSNTLTFFPHLSLSFSNGFGRRSGQMGSNTASHSFYLWASSLSPNSTLKTTILPLIPDLNSSFGHTACSWIVTSEEINPFIKNAWPGSTYCLALQSLRLALIYQLWRNY